MNPLKTTFLEQIAKEAKIDKFTAQLQYWAFMCRFNQDFEEYPSTHKSIDETIANLVDEKINGTCQRTIDPTISTVIRKIRNSFAKEIQSSEIPLERLRRNKNDGRPANEEGQPWKVLSEWLWGIKYISWVEDYIWNEWKAQATPNSKWIDFSDGAKGLKIPAPEATPILPKDTPLSVQINIDKPESYLLLFNRGIKILAEETQEEVLTKFLIAPSQGFAPNSKLTKARMLMPQKGSMAADNNMKFEFDAASTEEYSVLEEYVAILVDEEVDLEWLKPDPANPALEWDGSHLEQLWNQLQKQNTQIFHREFEVQEVETLVA